MGGASCKCEHCGKWFLATTIPSEHIKTCWQRRINHLEAENARLNNEVVKLKEELARVTKLSATEAAALIPAVMEYAADMDKQLAAAQLDAARYRWIREDAVGREAAAMSMIDAFCEDDLDAAIDSAMKGEQS